MKISVRALKGTRFEIEAKPGDSIAEVKTSIERVQGSDVYPAIHQMLVYDGDVLKNDATLDEYKVSKDRFLVVMSTKNRPSPPVATPASTSHEYLELVDEVCESGGGACNRIKASKALCNSDLDVEKALEYLNSENKDMVAIKPAAKQAVAVPRSGGPNTDPLNLFTNNIGHGSSNAGLSAGALNAHSNILDLQTFLEMIQENPEVAQHIQQQLQGLPMGQMDNLPLMHSQPGPEGAEESDANSSGVPRQETLVITQQELEAIETSTNDGIQPRHRGSRVSGLQQE